MRKVSTNGVPDNERFGCWRELVAKTLMPVDTRCEPQLERSFQAKLDICELGSVLVALMTGTPHEVHRTPKLIRQAGPADPEVCLLGLGIRGAVVIAQDDRQAEVTPGDFFFYDTSRPYSGALSPNVPASQMLIVRFARSLLPLSPRQLGQLTAVRIPGNHGVGALTSQFLRQLAQHFDDYSPADAARLSGIALDVLAAAFAHALDADKSLPPQTHHRALQARIHTFIQQNLGDPELTPGAIAAAHHISVRYLHKLFHEQGCTVAGWIRERRLERCRRDLADPLLADRPISAIAATWGFTNPAHFSQAFRAAFGFSPREFRATVHGA
jgi:AraC-like DNA-binding protein